MATATYRTRFNAGELTYRKIFMALLNDKSLRFGVQFAVNAKLNLAWSLDILLLPRLPKANAVKSHHL